MTGPLTKLSSLPSQSLTVIRINKAVLVGLVLSRPLCPHKYTHGSFGTEYASDLPTKECAGGPNEFREGKENILQNICPSLKEIGCSQLNGRVGI